MNNHRLEEWEQDLDENRRQYERNIARINRKERRMIWIAILAGALALAGPFLFFYFKK